MQALLLNDRLISYFLMISCCCFFFAEKYKCKILLQNPKKNELKQTNDNK